MCCGAPRRGQRERANSWPGLPRSVVEKQEDPVCRSRRGHHSRGFPAVGAQDIGGLHHPAGPEGVCGIGCRRNAEDDCRRGGAPHADGEILATLENLDLSSTYEETRGELQIQRAALSLLRAGSRPEEIERARRQIETKKMDHDSAVRVEQGRKKLLETIAKKQAEFQNATLTHERSVELLKKGLVARKEADREKTAFRVQQRELSEAQGQLQVLEERTDNTRRIKAKELAKAESELLVLLAGSARSRYRRWRRRSRSSKHNWRYFLSNSHTSKSGAPSTVS